VNRVVIADHPVLLAGKDLFQVGSKDRHKCGSFLLSLYCKALVVKIDPLLSQKTIGFFQRLYSRRRSS
jgi:hypothetical protein